MTNYQGILCPELYAAILGQLWDDHEALRTCSLSCHILRPLAQELLFKKITVAFGPNEYRFTSSSRHIRGSRLKTILATSPHIGAYVEVLEIGEMGPRDSNWFLNEELPEEVIKGFGEDESLARNTSLNFCLPLLPRLKALSTELYYPKFLKTYWASTTQTGLLASLVTTMSLSSLTCLVVGGIPLALISYCPNLRYLWLESLLESDHNDEKMWFAVHIAPSANRIQLQSLAVSQDLTHCFTKGFLSQTVDLSALKTLFIKYPAVIQTDVQAFLEPCVNSVEELIFDPFHEGNRMIALPIFLTSINFLHM